jgi:hypothetical protein
MNKYSIFLKNLKSIEIDADDFLWDGKLIVFYKNMVKSNSITSFDTYDTVFTIRFKKVLYFGLKDLISINNG